MPRLPLYFDFLSPYSWIALMKAPRFAAEHGIAFEPVPVVLAALLDAHGLVGPVETPAKRAASFDDVVRCAALEGLRLTGPPTHPFRSLEALRAFWLFRGEPQALELARDLADAAWGAGRDLTDPEVLADVVAARGLDAAGLGERIASPEAKAGVRDTTREALERGVFGVPTVVHEGELFWGQDRLPHLAARLEGRLAPARETSAAMLARPAGARRRR